MCKGIIKALVLSGLFLASSMSYAQCEDAEYVVNSAVDVGLWDSFWNDGYVNAAYKELGEDLDGRSYLDDADVIAVNFVYTVHIWFWSGTGITTSLCLFREQSQSWSDVTQGIVDGSALNDVVGTDYSSGGGNGGDDGDDFWDSNDEGDINDWLDEIDQDDLWADDWSVEIYDFVDDYYYEEEDYMEEL